MRGTSSSNITIPMCTPVILFNLVIAFIYGFQNFTLPWLLTRGGPNFATELYTIFLYRNAFQYLRMGKASALAWILFLIIVIFTVLLFRTSERWVYYGGDEKLTDFGCRLQRDLIQTRSGEL